MSIADIIAILGGIGGLEFIKWLFTRKRVARSDEFRLLRETNEFLQTQQLEKEKRFAEQTQVLRATQRDLLETTKREADSGIAHARDAHGLVGAVVLARGETRGRLGLEHGGNGADGGGGHTGLDGVTTSHFGHLILLGC